MTTEENVIYTNDPYKYARMIARNSKRRWGGKCRDYMEPALKLAREELAKEANIKAKIKAKESELEKLKRQEL